MRLLLRFALSFGVPSNIPFTFFLLFVQRFVFIDPSGHHISWWPNRKCDVFSLGITLYEIISGRPLPPNGDEWHRLRSGRVNMPMGLPADLSQTLGEMMQVMMSSSMSWHGGSWGCIYPYWPGRIVSKLAVVGCVFEIYMTDPAELGKFERARCK